MPHSHGGPLLHHCGARPQQFLPSKQLKHHGPGLGLDLSTKGIQDRRATTSDDRARFCEEDKKCTLTIIMINKNIFLTFINNNYKNYNIHFQRYIKS